MNKLIYLFLGALSLASCGDAEDVTQAKGLDGETVEVAQEIQVNVLPIQNIAGASTRSGDVTPEKGEALTVTYASDAATRVTDMVAAESKITNAYIVQFNGTEPSNTVVWVSGDIKDQLAAGTPITCAFSLTTGRRNRVYVVANRTSAPTLGTTLSAFEAPIAYTVSDKVPSAGLPMSAMQDVGVGDTFDVFQLRSLVAKLTVTCRSAGANLFLFGLPNEYSYFRQAAGDTPFRSEGMTYANSYRITSGVTYYVPQNLSGRNDLLIKHYTRALGMAPANAMYVVIDATTPRQAYFLLLGDGTPQDFNVVAGYSYKINATILGANQSSDMRVGNPLPVGTSITDLNSDGRTANCYIASNSSAWYMFNNTVMGNGAITPEYPGSLIGSGVACPAIIPSKLTPASGEVLWETINRTIMPNMGEVVKAAVFPLKDHFLFNTGTSEGNAVIAARDAKGDIIWSWHIWRLNAPPTGITLKAITSVAGNNELAIMDRNLGALTATENSSLSIGLFYQWGRKDPMPGVATLAKPSSAMSTNPTDIPIIPGAPSTYTVAQSIQKPTTFFRSDDDWCSTRNDNLWGTPLISSVSIVVNSRSLSYNKNRGSKTIYDPCPVGWRVPPDYAFANAFEVTCPWSAQGFFRNFTVISNESSQSSHNLLAAGIREGPFGVMSTVTEFGAYWTASPCVGASGHGSSLMFNATILVPQHSLYRSSGFNVRCVKETK